MNTVNLIGRLTKDAEVREIEGKDGNFLQAVFFLAVDRNEDEADFIRCVAYGRIAEVIDDHTGKGVRVGITGHLKSGSYEHKDGYTVFTLDVIVDRFDFADGKKGDEAPKRGDEAPKRGDEAPKREESRSGQSRKKGSRRGQSRKKGSR